MNEKLTDEEWIHRGNIYLKSKTFTQALEYFENAIKVNPENAVAWFKKGLILHQQRNYNEALLCYDKSLILDPSLEEVKNKRLDLVLDMGPDNVEDEKEIEQPDSESSPETWKRYDKKRTIIEIKTNRVFRLFGLIFISFGVLSFIILVFSFQSMYPDWGAFIAGVSNILIGVILFIIAGRFYMITLFLKEHVPKDKKQKKH